MVNVIYHNYIIPSYQPQFLTIYGILKKKKIKLYEIGQTFYFLLRE